MPNNTKFTDIYRFFAVVTQDPYLKRIAESIDSSDTELLDDILEILLRKAITKFPECAKSLKFDKTTLIFESELEDDEMSILCDYMTLVWWDRNINNLATFELKLNDTGFKHSSEGTNLEKKTETMTVLRSKLDQDVIDYGLKYAPWEEWVMGKYVLHNK